ncbi:DUF881 domain-containing protein [Nocardioides marinquilinus]|uniref:DUF881 domain-containing protein n=1 Tax=Nocardioides marinquilinus TaxID=1210400 RepID=A0ABP9Q3I2_9ACTN
MAEPTGPTGPTGPTRPTGPTGPGRRPPADVPEQVRLPLLTLITQQSLDEDYRTAAARRAAGAPLPPRDRPRRTAAVVIGVFGLLAATAFVQTSRNADAASASRETLIAQIENRRGVLARQTDRVARLNDRNTALERSVTDLTGQTLEADGVRETLATGTGFVAVEGEGLRVTVTEPENADENQQVKDEDLALLVNGLWEAGAEAVAVNGRRLTARSAIRTSGLAIKVNGVGIAAPYTVEAVGDTRVLAARLFETTSGLLFADNATTYGFSYDLDNVDALELPAAPPGLAVLRTAVTSSDDPRAERGGDGR